MSVNRENNGEIIFDPENQEEIKNFRRAFAIVLNDSPTEPVDAVFLHPLSHGDDDEMFPLAAKLITEGKAQCIVTNGSNGEKLGDTKPGVAWAGKEEYIRRLTSAGVPEDKIILSRPAFHTRQNNDVFQEIAEQKGWKSAATLNQPQQLLRATLGQIRTMQLSNYWMRLYSIYPEPWEAAKRVYGSQGAQQDRRFTLLPSDFERILNYQSKGDLATFKEFFKYIANRSNIR
jgi:hypothetical protein